MFKIAKELLVSQGIMSSAQDVSNENLDLGYCHTTICIKLNKQTYCAQLHQIQIHIRESFELVGNQQAFSQYQIFIVGCYQRRYDQN